MGNKRGFTLIETMVAASILVLVMGVFFEMLHYGILASNRGQIQAQARENARIILDRVASELRQAVPLPTLEAPFPNGQTNPIPSAVIYPGSGGTTWFTAEPDVMGCSSPYSGISQTCASGNACILDSSISVTEINGQMQTGPDGFIIFSELIQRNGGTSGVFVPGDQNYNADPRNYIWVMYQVASPSNAPPVGRPAALFRYTFKAADANGNLLGLVQSGNQWSRNDSYFVPGNSREGSGGEMVDVLSSLKDQMWIMVSHGSPPTSEQTLRSGVTLDPQLFHVTVVVEQAAMRDPMLKAVLSSDVRIQGSVP